MAGVCRGCGGIIGRDCFNPPECEWISSEMERDYHEAMREMEREHYAELEGEYHLELMQGGAGLS